MHIDSWVLGLVPACRGVWGWGRGATPGVYEPGVFKSRAASGVRLRPSLSLPVCFYYKVLSLWGLDVTTTGLAQLPR